MPLFYEILAALYKQPKTKMRDTGLETMHFDKQLSHLVYKKGLQRRKSGVIIRSSAFRTDVV